MAHESTRSSSVQRIAAIAVLLLFAIFGGVVLMRSAFQERRKTDAGVFFRAGWAVRESVDPYTVTDDNGWKYLYAPGIAPLFVPLSDPPTGLPRAGHMPYAVSVALWYTLSALLTFAAVHWIALALTRATQHLRDLDKTAIGWWNIRIFPILAMAPDIGSSLSKGQVGSVMLAAIAAGMLLIVRERRVWAGALIALACFIKPFAGLLLLERLYRRDLRTLLGVLACALATGVIIPVIAYGPAKALEHTRTFAFDVLLPAAAQTDENTNRQAGTGFSNTDNLSFQGTLHNLANLGTPRGQRPNAPETWVKPVHLALSVVLTAITIAAFASAQHALGLAAILRLSMLCGLMLLAVPMCHRHYFIFILPMVSCLVFVGTRWSTTHTPTPWAWGVIVLVPLLMTLPRLAQVGLLRDLPIPQLVTLALWAMCLGVLRRLSRERAA